MIIDLLSSFNKHVVKSINMLVHMMAGMGTGFNATRGFTVSPLCHWKMSHLSVKV
jgi:hypothetical protein